MSVPICPKEPGDQGWIDRLPTERWGSGQVVMQGRVCDARDQPGLVAGGQDGLATFAIDHATPIADLVTIDAVTPGRGMGSALVAALIEHLRARNIRHLRVTTTNDNLDALRFYQRRGFRILTVCLGAVDTARRLKPSIPAVGAYGIPIRDEIDLERQVTSENQG